VKKNKRLKTLCKALATVHQSGSQPAAGLAAPAAQAPLPTSYLRGGRAAGRGGGGPSPSEQRPRRRSRKESGLPHDADELLHTARGGGGGSFNASTLCNPPPPQTGDRAGGSALPCRRRCRRGVGGAASAARGCSARGKALGHGRSVRAVGREQAGAPQYTRLARWWRTTTQRDALGETLPN